MAGTYSLLYQIENGYNEYMPKGLVVFSVSNSMRELTLSKGCGTIVTWECLACGGACQRPYGEMMNSKNCPYCSHQKLLSGTNDLFTQYPHLAEFWNEKEPMDSHRAAAATKVNWKCPSCRGQWQQRINKIKYLKDICPYCSHRKVLTKFNDAATKFPELRELWSPSNPKRMEETLANNKSVYLLTCSQCHSQWKSNGIFKTECQSCQLRVGDVPDLAKQFNEQKNRIKSHSMLVTSSAIVWWKCELGHQWKDCVNKRYRRKNQCPYCAHRRTLAGFNDLLTTHPELARSWSLRNQLDVTQVRFHQALKSHWECQECHFRWSSDRIRQQFCLNCYPASKLEREVFREIQQMDKNSLLTILVGTYPLNQEVTSTNERKKKLQLDIYLPELKIAFEVQDFATHSRLSNYEFLEGVWKERGGKSGLCYKKGPLYHETKRQLAWEQLGVKLYDVWEDEILDKSFHENIGSLIDC
jgi:uncharacterized Zn-finger protein